MKFFRRIILFALMIILTFTLVGCTGDDAEVKELQDRVEELLGQVDEIQATLQDKQSLLDAAVEARAALEEIMLDLVDNPEVRIPLIEGFAKAGLLSVKSYEWTNLDDLLEDAETETIKGVKYYVVDAGFVFDAKFKVVVEAGEDSIFAGLEIETEFTGADFVGFDYFWTTTYDYNKGIEFDEDSKLTFKLPGYYGLAFYSADQAGAGEYYAQDLEALVDEDEVPAELEDKFTLLYFAVSPGAQLLTSDEDLSLEIKVGATNQLAINKPAKYTVVSYKSGDTDVLTVSATGLVSAVAVGKTYVEAVVKEGDVEITVSMPATVFPVPTGVLAGGETGAFLNLKDSTVEQKAKILAHMERHLLNKGASIPVFNNSGLIIYTERVNFIAEEYVAQMGYGPTAVPMTTGTATGVGDDLPYRMWTSANPSTLNHLAYADSIESDFLTLLEGSLFSFDWKVDEDGVGTGWNIKPEMATKLAYPVKLEGDKYVELADWHGLTTSDSWRVDIRKDLKWENGDKLDVNDFIYTFKEALDGNLAYRRANLFTGGSLPIAGAKEYYDAKGTLAWDTVGIKQIDDYSFVVTFKNSVPQWDVIYNWGGFIFTPIHKATYESNKATYGTSKERFMASGPYKLSYWEAGKEYRFTKNDKYFAWEGADVEVRRPLFENLSYTIVKDANAALALFKEQKLDVTSVPASAYDEFKNWQNQKFTPGATSFRLSVNRMTQAESDVAFGKGSWVTKPILQEDDFMWALYFGMDREGVQAITKTSTAWSSYFTNAYSLVSSTESGTEIETYRMTEWGHKAYEGVFAGDIDLDEENLGYNQALATQFYVKALDSLFAKGEVVQGTVANPTKISIEVAHFDGVVQEAVWGYVVQKYNELFNNTTKYGKTVIFEAVSAPQPGMDVYYVKQMAGQYDLAQAGISGGTLDPVGFLETFCDDNRSGLLLSLGFDTHNPNILIDLDLDGDGVDDGAMWWSFDALYSAFNGKSFIKQGKEAKAPAAN